MAVFILFFGASVIESIQSGSWNAIIFWLIICLVFLLADMLKKTNDDKNKSGS